MRSLGGDWPPGKKKASHGFLLKKSSAGLFSIKPSGHLDALLTALLYGTVNFIVEHKWNSTHGWKNTQSRNERYCPAIKEVGHGWYQSMGYIFFYISVKFLHFLRPQWLPTIYCQHSTTETRQPKKTTTADRYNRHPTTDTKQPTEDKKI
jgi:hypothetical protein